MSAILVVSALIGAGATSACSDITGPSSLTESTLAGPWALVAQQPAGQPQTPPPSGANFGFELSGSRVSVTADCNRCNGTATIDGTSVTVGPALACTRAFCSSSPFDSAFLHILADKSTASIDGDMLTLRSERGTLRFQHTK